MKNLKNLIPLLFILIGCGTEPEAISTLLFSPDNLTIDVGGTGDVTLKVKDLEDSVFGISMCVAYDSTLVTFNEATDFLIGDFFGSEMVAFVKAESSLIHMSMVLKQGQSAVDGSGSLGVLTFTGKSQGSGALEIITSELYFYDANGEGVTIADLEVESATITVQ